MIEKDDLTSIRYKPMATGSPWLKAIVAALPMLALLAVVYVTQVMG